MDADEAFKRIKVVDPHRAYFKKMALINEWQKLEAKSTIELAILAKLKTPPPPSNLLVGDAASQYLESLVPVVQDEIKKQHSGYGAVQWLWYLRRAPKELFSGSYRTTLGYDYMLAEALSWNQTSTDFNDYSSGQISFKVDDESFHNLCNYIGAIKYLSQLHIAYRRVGKGATLDLSLPVVMTQNSKEIEAAIELYDTRHDHSFELIGSRLGLSNLEANHSKLNEISSNETEMLLLFGATEPYLTPVIYPYNGKLTIADVDAQYVLKVANVKNFLTPLSVTDIPDYVLFVAPLIQLLVLMPLLCLRFPWALSSAIQQGYFFVRENNLAAEFDYLLPEINKQLQLIAPNVDWCNTYINWKNAIHDIVPSLWPLLGGGVLRHHGPNILIDITSASQALIQRIELSRSPSIGNKRASKFEQQCQQLINNSAWKPSELLASFRARTLRRNSVPITDIDAIGECGEILLLISCKSLIYDGEYDKGTYRVIRNTQSTVDNAVQEWNNIIENIRANPVGDNFDFSKYKVLIGVVCTPFVVYSSNEYTHQKLNGISLRACVSSIELKEWLEQNPIS